MLLLEFAEEVDKVLIEFASLLVLPAAVDALVVALAGLLVQIVGSPPVLQVVLVPNAIILVLVGTAASLEVLLADLDELLGRVERVSDGVPVQQVPVELLREDVADLIHDVLL